jgi:hypothetical protein
MLCQHSGIRSYRGQEYADLGLALAEEGWLTPRMIGDASRSGRHDELALKRLWHCVARFGAPAGEGKAED